MSLTAPPVDPRAPLPAVVILGNDALLAARPATPVQLAHACLALGFRAAIPVSWGDELIAAASLDVIAARAPRPAIHCACPHVARRVLAVGTELAPHLVSLVAPPVAAARYLRSHAPQGLRITYIGRCPAASDDVIDARLTPEEFLAQLADRQIDLRAQPEVFESVIPPDRRRHHSLPGGVPAPEELWRATQLRMETLRGDDIATDIAERVLARAEVLLDPAPALGCVCSGALRGVELDDARGSVVALEPPRSPLPVVEVQRAISLELPVPVAARAVVEAAAERSRAAEPPAPERREGLAPPLLIPELPLGTRPPTPPAEQPMRRPRLTPPGSPVVSAPPMAASGPSPISRRRSTPGSARVVPGTTPVAADAEGRLLPRAYVARRRSSPRTGVSIVTEQSLSPSAPSSPAPAAPAAPGSAVAAEPREAERPIEHSVEPAPRQTTSAPSNPDAVAAQVPAPVAAAEAPLAAAVEPEAMTGGETRHVAPPARGPVERSLTFVVSNPRVALVLLLAAAGMLAGVAIGYAAARRGEPARSEALGGEPQRLRIDSSAASASPALTTPRSAPSTGARSAPGARRIAPGARRGGTGPSLTSPVVPRTATDAGTGAGTPAPVPPTVAPSAPAVVDSAPIRARRDSLAAAARVDSVAAEREAIRREIERRRARIDSIIRAQGSSPPSR